MSESLIIAEFLIYLFLVWFLWYVLIRDYQKDKFRQKLFDLRDELFDYAAADNIDFKHPLYTYLRQLLNRTIRFSDRVDLFSLSFMILFGKGKIWTETDVYNHEKERKQLFSSIDDPDVNRKLELFYHSYARSVGLHLLETSVLAIVLVFIASIIILISKIFTDGFKVLRRLSLEAIELYFTRRETYSKYPRTVKYLAYTKAA